MAHLKQLKSDALFLTKLRDQFNSHQLKFYEKTNGKSAGINEERKLSGREVNNDMGNRGVAK